MAGRRLQRRELQHVNTGTSWLKFTSMGIALAMLRSRYPGPFVYSRVDPCGQPGAGPRRTTTCFTRQDHALPLPLSNQLAGFPTKINGLRQAIANGPYLDKFTWRMCPFFVRNTDTHSRNIETDRNIRVSAG